MATPCTPYDPIRGLLNKAGMICRQMSLPYADDHPARVALLNAAREIEALPRPDVSGYVNGSAEAKKVLDAALVAMDARRPEAEVRKDYVRLREAVAAYRSSISNEL